MSETFHTEQLYGDRLLDAIDRVYSDMQRLASRYETLVAQAVRDELLPLPEAVIAD